MAYDAHLLTRLERIRGPALDLALGLYRDTPLLKWTLGRLPLPDGADVVALPLLPGEAPPYALVSRSGKFITCLGAGMTPGRALVIRWPPSRTQPPHHPHPPHAGLRQTGMRLVRPPPAPARNEVCTCGSGKKYKKCCGT